MALETSKGIHHINVNRLLGITPVAANWGTDPTNLARCGDDDWATPTGTGSTVLGAAGEVGRLTFDLGAIYNIILTAKLLHGNNIVAGAATTLDILGSEDNVTYYPFLNLYGGHYMDEWIANDTQVFFIVAFLRARYIRIVWNGAAAGTWYGAVYEVQALDQGL